MQSRRVASNGLSNQTHRAHITRDSIIIIIVVIVGGRFLSETDLF